MNDFRKQVLNKIFDYEVRNDKNPTELYLGKSQELELERIIIRDCVFPMDPSDPNYGKREYMGMNVHFVKEPDYLEVGGRL